MAKASQPIDKKRRKPHQARAAATVAAILEGAAQVLEAGGLAAFTTNAVAERAGVSIGTLYQYFADKNALLRAIAEREMAQALTAVAAALRGESEGTVESRVRAMVRAIVNAFHGRQRARKAVVQAVLAQGLAIEMMAPVASFIAAEGAEPRRGLGQLSREQVFVLSRALMGTIRAAVLEEQPFFKSAAFEDELVRLVLSYLNGVRQLDAE
ncbi:MAG: helix-turn-helix transcriptional regulator [Proteobacteria bacterium]|nr:helix-turn-helix transcriptional regulator [Pseudomonadota bacterium]